MLCLCVTLSTMSMSYPGRSEEGIRSPELKLCKVFSCHMDTGNGTWVLCKNNSALNHWASVQPIPQQGDSWVLYYFPHCCVKIPPKDQFWKGREDYFSFLLVHCNPSRQERYSSSGQRLQSGSRERWMLALCSSSPHVEDRWRPRETHTCIHTSRSLFVYSKSNQLDNED